MNGSRLALALVALCGASAFAGDGGSSFSKRLLMISPNEGCAIGDVNRDGHPDIVAGPNWFAGPNFVPRPLRDVPQVDLGFGTRGFFANNGDHLLDVDGDGWVDVISGGWKQKMLYWYENPGKEALKKGWKWPQHELATTPGTNEAFDLVDLDGSGTPEILSFSWVSDAPVVAWRLRNRADGEITTERVVIGASGAGHGYAIGDVNGDGHTDVLTESGWYEHPGKDVFAEPWELHRETALDAVSSPFVVADVDGDGRNDLVWGKGHDYGLYWWEQGEPKPDGTTTWTEHLIDDSFSQIHTLTWADIDGDGKGELLAGKRVRGHGGQDPGADEGACLYSFHWNPEAEEFVRCTISPPGDGVGTGMQIRVGDLNEDGHADIAVAGKTGTWLLLNEGNGP